MKSSVQKILGVVLVALIVIVPMAGVAQAGSSNNTFNVTVTLTSSCTIGAIADVAFGAYTSGQAGPVSSVGGTFNMTCTSTLPITSFTFDAAASTVVGLNYVLTAPVPVAGTGAAQAYAISGTMAGGQYGTCNLASCAGTQSRTLTVNF